MPQPSYEELQAQLAGLQEQLQSVTKEKTELELVVETITTHSDLVEEELWQKVASVPDELQDPVTKLYNHSFMQEILDREMSRCKRHGFPLTLIMVAVDHSDALHKILSDTVRDMAMQYLGRVLQVSIRREDIACRYNDETFVLILPQASQKNMKPRAEQIRLKIKAGLKTPHQDDILGITVSLGIAGYPEHGMTTQELLGAAMLALEHARQKGSDRVEMAVLPVVIQ